MHSIRLLLAFSLVLTLAVPVAAQTVRPARVLPLSAEAVILMDPDGNVLYAKNPDFERAPASLTKLMSLYLAFEDIEAGRTDLDEPVKITRSAVTVGRYRMGLRLGELVPLRTILEGVAIASANDAAAALAEHLGGIEPFVARMNAKARQLGLTCTHFANPHGLPDPRQHSCAIDIAHLIIRLLQDYPASRTLLGGQTFVYDRRVYARHIPLFRDPGGVQALKTGFTNDAGYNLAVSAWRDGHQFIMIVLGAHSRALSYADGKKLLHYGFVEAGIEIQPEPRPRFVPRRAARARRVAASR